MPTATLQATHVPIARTTLPSSTASGARANASGVAQWLIGTNGATPQASHLAREAGGTYDPALGLVTIRASRAAKLARRLGKAVRWAGPDRRATRTSSFDRPGNVQTPWARSFAAAPSLTPAAGTLAPIGIVDDAVDHSVAELQSADVINGVGPVEPHGTMVASVAAAPYDGVGVVGVAPGAQVLSWGSDLGCGDVSSGIVSLVRQGARVINTSLSFAPRDACFALWQATAYAYARGVTIVAASGNDALEGNVSGYPASYPHVVTVGAVDSTLAPADFSTHDPQVDLAAPGVKVPVDVPMHFDTLDGAVNGLSEVDGTSFASPFVAGGVSWLVGARPSLDPGQVSSILRSSSRDLAAAGWDERTGFGLIQVSAALASSTPTADPGEPNDDPAFLRRRGAFASKTTWAGTGRATVTAVGDSADDPVDAYRIKVPARTSVRIRLAASTGLTDLFAFDGRVQDFSGRPLASSSRTGRSTDALTLRNGTRAARDAFVVVNSIDDGIRTGSSYALTIQRSN